ncbi:hypothetical protein HK096_002420 [Nowakowskiella sp. JEL0078]|nr:hypothetical protein HK096_002420 [Nowakowskiella sp. JEL0078]
MNLLRQLRRSDVVDANLVTSTSHLKIDALSSATSKEKLPLDSSPSKYPPLHKDHKDLFYDLNAKSEYDFGESLLLSLLPQNLKQASKHLKKAAFKLNYPDAQALLGLCYEFGLGVSRDNKSAESLYLCAAKSNIGLAFVRLAVLRRYSRPGVHMDRVEADEWFTKCREMGEICVAWLLKAAEKFNLPVDKSNLSIANYCLGVCYHDGICVAPDAFKAFTYYQRALNYNLDEPTLPDALTNLALCLHSGTGTPPNITLAFRLFHTAATHGDVTAMYNIGHCFETGVGVAKSLEDAVMWYYKAAERGCCYAQNCLGYLCEEGLGIEQDAVRAVQFYSLAADQGMAWAQCNLGFCLQNGIGVQKDEVAGIRLFMMAAVQGHSRSQHNLGHAYHHGIGVSPSLPTAVHWYKLSSSSNIFAMHSLGYCMQHGLGTHADPTFAVTLYKRAADRGHAPAQLALAACYRSGIGVSQNSRAAATWVRRAAEGGNDVAMHMMGEMTAAGEIKGDSQMWFRRASTAGNVGAMVRLAGLLLESDGTGDEAVELLRSAIARGGSGRALTILGKCVLEGVGCDVDTAEAMTLFERAADSGDVEGMVLLARCLEDSTDVEGAIEWYQKAAATGDPRAAERLMMLSTGLMGVVDEGFVALAA